MNERKQHATGNMTANGTETETKKTAKSRNRNRNQKHNKNKIVTEIEHRNPYRGTERQAIGKGRGRRCRIHPPEPMTYLRTYQSLRVLGLSSRTQDVLAGDRCTLCDHWLTPPNATNAINAPMPPQIPTVSYPIKPPVKTHMRVASQGGTLLVLEPLDEGKTTEPFHQSTDRLPQVPDCPRGG